ncbi:MAG: nitroreductase family protein [Candidatus Omnitrophica bacterium]|nr:nitroreductase family protein [Candidatus Omnitrophota bacterium]
MAALTIDKTECISCGTCIAECPVRIIAMDPAEKIPAITKGAEELCINCGHCVCACPKSAASLDTMDVTDCKDLPQDWQLSPAKVEALLKGRRSIRNFKDDPVDKKILTQLIDTARYAPSGINRQPVKWAVVHEKAKVAELSKLVCEWMKGLIKNKAPLVEALRLEHIVQSCDEGHDRICRGAPHAVIAYALKDDMLAPQAATIALSYLDLIAVSYGLGTCWAGYVHMAVNASPDVVKFLGLSKKSACFGAMLVGYPKFDYYAIPLRNKPHIVWVPKA